jgi:hypothetical protein
VYNQIIKGGIMDSLTIKFFTLEEANALVPEICEMVKEIKSKKHKLIKKINEAAEIKTRVMTNGNRQELKEKIEQILTLQERLTDLRKSLLVKGLIIRDIDQGVFDFPTIIERDLAYFCWTPEESSISYWHPVNKKTRCLLMEKVGMMHTSDNYESGKQSRY